MLTYFASKYCTKCERDEACDVGCWVMAGSFKFPSVEMIIPKRSA